MSAKVATTGVPIRVIPHYQRESSILKHQTILLGLWKRVVYLADISALVIAGEDHRPFCAPKKHTATT
jgi:hypothetical protein